MTWCQVHTLVVGIDYGMVIDVLRIVKSYVRYLPVDCWLLTCALSLCSWKNHHQRRARGHVGEWQAGHLHRWCKHRTWAHLGQFNLCNSASGRHPQQVSGMQNGHEVRWHIRWTRLLSHDMQAKEGKGYDGSCGSFYFEGVSLHCSCSFRLKAPMFAGH